MCGTVARERTTLPFLVLDLGLDIIDGIRGLKLDEVIVFPVRVFIKICIANCNVISSKVRGGGVGSGSSIVGGSVSMRGFCVVAEFGDKVEG